MTGSENIQTIICKLGDIQNPPYIPVFTLLLGSNINRRIRVPENRDHHQECHRQRFLTVGLVQISGIYFTITRDTHGTRTRSAYL